MSELHVKFGEVLQIERGRRGLSLEDLSTELKISQENLQAIEAGEPQVLPSEPYYNLFAKSYAQFLGIDFAATMDAIKEEIGERQALEELREAGATEASRKESDKKLRDKSKDQPKEIPGENGPGKKLFIIAGIVIVVFVVFILSYKLLFSSHENATGEEVANSGGSEAVEEIIEGDAEVNAEYASYDWAGAKDISADSLHLVLTAREESWATVMADGDTVLYQNLSPWREYTIDAHFRLMVSVGVPRLVEITLNGKPAYLADAESGRISRVEINQVNWQTFMEPPPPKAARQEASLTTPPSTTAPSTNDAANQQNQTATTPRREPATVQPTVTAPPETTAATIQGTPQRPVDTIRADTAKPSVADTAKQEDEAARPSDRTTSPYSGTRRTQPETADNGGGTL